MYRITTITFLVVSFIAISHGHYHGRMRSNTYPVHNNHRDLSCSCSCNDISALMTLVRTLEEKECCSAKPTPNESISNANDLIMNLVNALIQLTSQALSRNNCHCPNQSGTNNNNPTSTQNGGSGNNHYNEGSGNNHHNGGSAYSHSDGGLNLDLLNPNKKDNVLDLDLARQHLLGVALGGGGGDSQGSNSYNSNGRSASGGNDEVLVNVDLNPNKKSNVAEVDLRKQLLVSVGTGGGGSVPSQTTNSMTGSGSNGLNQGEGLINVNILNPIKQNNITDVDVLKHSVIDISSN